MAVANWSTTAALNVESTGVAGTGGGVNIDEGMARSDVNNALRSVMAQIATFITSATYTGTSPLTLTSTDAGAAAGPILTLYRNSATPAASDIIGQVLFQGEDSAGNTQDYGAIDVQIDDTTSTSEDATLRFRAVVAGTMTNLMTQKGALTTIGSSTAASEHIIGRAVGSGVLSVTASAAGTFDGGLRFFGPSHATQAYDIVFDSGVNGSPWTWDHSAEIQTFRGQLLLNGGSTLDGQIRFPSTQNPSANVNTLDDYEEGTFTPGMTFGGSASGVTFSTQQGRYTKIGNVVIFDIQITLTSNGSGTGAAVVTGLPFTAAARNQAVAVTAFSGFSGLTAGASGYVDTGGTTISLRMPNTTGSAAATDTNVTDTALFYVSGCYQT